MNTDSHGWRTAVAAPCAAVVMPRAVDANRVGFEAACIRRSPHHSAGAAGWAISALIRVNPC